MTQGGAGASQYLPDTTCESGQTLVFMAVFMLVIMGFCAVVIDGGNYLVTRRNLQGNADAAALAAVRDILDSEELAELTATDYVENQNSDDGAEVEDIEFLTDNRMKVTVVREEPGFFGGVLGIDAATVRASATVQVRQATAMAGALPLAFMRDSYTMGDNEEIKTDSPASNHGAVSPDNTPPTCGKSTGASDFRELIKGPVADGLTACAHLPGDEFDTETGNMSGPTKQGLDDRINGNTDSFEDVFEYDADADKYIVKKPDSPRLGMVPVIENTNGSNNWPSGKKAVVVLRYIFVYIGKTDDAPDYPAYTNNGKSVWVTPVDAMLPADWDSAELGNYDPDSDAPILYGLIE